MQDVDEEMMEFLKYIENSTDEVAKTELVRIINQKVSMLKEDKKVEVEYMTLLERDKEKFQEGIEQGIVKANKQMAKKLLNKGMSIEEVMSITELTKEEVGGIYVSNIEVLKNITDEDVTSILQVWESSVRATHLFLTDENIVSLRPFVEEGVKFISNLAVIRDRESTIQAFIGVQNNKIEMLFVKDTCRGKGLGKHLVNWAISTLNANFVDVNEQNEQGLGFYKYMGFKVFDRSELDEQGNPFPILHMKS